MSTNNDKNIIYLAIWGIVLAFFWVLLSGFFTPLLLGLGALSVILVVALLWKMNSIDGQLPRIPINLNFLSYVIWLLGQVFKSSLQVTRLVWTNSTNLHPVMVKLPIDHIPLKTRVLYANSITLTPGTLSIDIDDEHITVHALEQHSIAELGSGAMANKASSLVKGGD
ncbi:Na+/H+ antiporter subunit E [Psychrobium sp. nBUS_13]|uniref:Na+/H+ antiporter subunit E n=1 Tax=Psychrobium sp. nBUS_13 TaxID=3395319 RepID=UPI003EBCC176